MVLHHNLQLLSIYECTVASISAKKSITKLSILSRSKKSNLVISKVTCAILVRLCKRPSKPSPVYLPTYPCSYRANCLHRNSYPSFTAAIPVPVGSSLGNVSKRCFAPSGQATPHSTPLASSAAMVSRLMLQGTKSSSVPCMMKVGVR